jgi:hypothetical protein
MYLSCEDQLDLATTSDIIAEQDESLTRRKEFDHFRVNPSANSRPTCSFTRSAFLVIFSH